jgi:pyridoxal phosphate enzyme (YggS family)
MVGHIQSRKARQVPALFSMVHSVDRLKLAHKLSALAAESGSRLQVLLEINISGEAAKSGIAAAGWGDNSAVKAALWDAVGAALVLPGLEVRGLMTMAPIVDDMEAVRPVFAGLRTLRDALADSFQVALPELSMGMTDDYPVAIEEGATIIRVGRAIFGPRSE